MKKLGKIDVSQIVAITPPVVAGNIEANLKSVEKCVARATKLGAKIAVLPLNVLSGDLGFYSSTVFSAQVKEATQKAVSVLAKKVEIVCVFATDYSGVVIENGCVNYTSFHTTQEGVNIYVAQDFDDLPNLSTLPTLPQNTQSNSQSNSQSNDTQSAINSQSNNIQSNDTQKVDVIALPMSTIAYINGANQTIDDCKRASKLSGAIVVGASNGNGNSTFKFVRSAEKFIAFDGEIKGYSYKDTDEFVFGNSNILSPSLPCASTQIGNNPNNNPVQIGNNPNNNPTQNNNATWIPQDTLEVFDIVSRGIYARMKASKSKKLVFGLSGGLDSTAVLLFSAYTADKYGFDRKDIVAVRMPSQESGNRTQSNAEKLAEFLNVDSPEIAINVEYRLNRINHSQKDVVYENAQARERASILLDLANKVGGLVLGTSDLTEIALGFSTFGGDQLAHYNPNSGLTKLALRKIVGDYVCHILGDCDNHTACDSHTVCDGDTVGKSRTVCDGDTVGKSHTINSGLKACLDDILNTPYSPELKPSQSSENILGPYKVFEFFLLRLCAYNETRTQILAMAKREFGEFSDSQLQEFFETFAKRLMFGRFKQTAGCDGIILTPFDLSLFDINADLSPEFLLSK